MAGYETLTQETESAYKILTKNRDDPEDFAVQGL
jgi:hypothetical protein